jgi:hypothetical protein
MGKVWVLDTETKGTGAQMVPLEKVTSKPAPESAAAARSRKRRAPRAQPARARSQRPKPKPPAARTSTPLPPGHVRKKATGEIGRVRSVDPRAGTATVLWLRQGRASTVPLTAIARR